MSLLRLQHFFWKDPHRQQYEPLKKPDSTRLLRLRSSGTEDPPRYALEPIRLKSAQKYNALSYTWGAPSQHAAASGVTNKRNSEITCNGEVALVTQNLYTFLQTARTLPSVVPKNKPIWIDAVCINQDNISERNQQVSLMTRIYSGAQTVFVWLGEEEDETAAAMELVRHLATLPMDLLETVDQHWFDTPSNRAILGRFAQSVQHWSALASFFRRTWFDRAWIFQEVAVARKVTVLCGRHVIPWPSLVHVSAFLTNTGWSLLLMNMNVQVRPSGSYLEMSGSRLGTTPSTIEDWRQFRTTNEGWHTEFGVMSINRFHCTDPRDKIYSILGITGVKSKQIARDYLSPDYARPAEQVYLDTTIGLILDLGNLNMLSFMEDKLDRSEEMRGLPSWVPDYSVHALGSPGLLLTQHYRAYGEINPKFEADRTKGLLHVRAGALDEIVQVAETVMDLQGDTAFPLCLQILNRMPMQYFTQQSRVEVFWRTLIADHLDEQVPAPKELAKSFKSWLLQVAANAYAMVGAEAFDETLAQLDNLSKTDDLISSTSTVKAVTEELLSISTTLEPGDDIPPRVWQLRSERLQYERVLGEGPFVRIFYTRKGYLGTGLRSAKPGDTIWVLPGASMLFILRPKSEPDNGLKKAFELVGESYVHGFMRGEALQQEGFHLEDVVIA